MRSLFGMALLIALAAGAQAKPGPAPDVRLTPSPSDTAIAVGAAGAMLESDYFKAPTRRVSSGSACRMQFDLFKKERLASACR